jgi:hypothetical protein
MRTRIQPISTEASSKHAELVMPFDFIANPEPEDPSSAWKKGQTDYRVAMVSTRHSNYGF